MSISLISFPDITVTVGTMCIQNVHTQLSASCAAFRRSLPLSRCLVNSRSSSYESGSCSSPTSSPSPVWCHQLGPPFSRHPPLRNKVITPLDMMAPCLPNMVAILNLSMVEPDVLNNTSLLLPSMGIILDIVVPPFSSAFVLLYLSIVIALPPSMVITPPLSILAPLLPRVWLSLLLSASWLPFSQGCGHHSTSQHYECSSSKHGHHSSSQHRDSLLPSVIITPLSIVAPLLSSMVNAIYNSCDNFILLAQAFILVPQVWLFITT